MKVFREHFVLFIALTLALALKIFLLALNAFPFNADEAVVALMARHILQGARPVFFYGQAYLGSLDAWLIAFAFWLMGQQVLAIRIVQTILYLGTIVTTYLLGLKIFDKGIAASAVLLLAIPTVLVTLYTTITLGGYGEVLLVGNILLLWTLRLVEKDCAWWEWLLFGALAGFGFWSFGLLGVYFPPIALAILYKRSDLKNLKTFFFSLFTSPSLLRYSVTLIGLLIGSAPWWQATLFGAATVDELAGAHVPDTRLGLLSGPALRLFNLLLLGLPVIIGLRPSWAVKWLALPLAPVALVVGLGAMVWAGATLRRDWRRALVAGVGITTLIAFVATQFGADPSGRYFLPLAVPLALFTADLFKRVRQEYPRVAHGLLALMLIFNAWGNLESAWQLPFLSTQIDAVAQVDQRDLPAVMDFLRAEGETRGYGNYWVEFPIAFLSNEELIFEARLPYHEDFRYTARDNRYAPYAQLVAQAPRVAYITTKHPALNERLRQGFAQLRVTFSEKQIGDFTIFYKLSRKVEPQELGL